MPEPLIEKLRKLARPGVEMTMARLAVVGAEGLGQGGQFAVRIAGEAVFKRDRMVGKLNVSESSGLIWLSGKARSGPVVFKTPDGNYASINVISNRSEIEPQIKGGRLEGFRITVRVRGQLYSAPGIDTTQKDQYEYLNSKLADLVRQDIELVLNKARGYGSDIFGLGKEVHCHNNKVWQGLENNWEEIFRTIPVRIDVQAVVERPGLAVSPSPIDD